MSYWTRRGAHLAAVGGIAIACVVGASTPAYAAAGSTSSFGLKTAGILSTGTFASSSCTPGTCAPDNLASASVVGLLSTGVLATTATVTGASATVNDLSVTLIPLVTLTAGTVTSTCAINPTTGAVTGDSGITNGQIALVVGGPIVLAASAAPNTAVTLLSPTIASVVLNRQTTAPDGTLTVDAIFITLLNAQTVTVASSSCTPTTAEIPIATGKGLLLGGGLLGAVVLGYFIIRRTVLAPKHEAV